MPFPSDFRARLRYCQRFPISTSGTVNTAQVYSLRLSSLYDPDYTGTGHQPYQYDTLTSIYNKYIVEKVDFKIRVRQETSSPVSSLWTGISVITDTNVAASAQGDTLDEIRERSTALAKPIPTLSNSENYVEWKGSVVNHKAFGITPTQYYGDDPTFGAAYNANPTRQLFLELFLVDPAAGSSATVYADVELVFHAKFYGYVAPAQS